MDQFIRAVQLSGYVRVGVARRENHIRPKGFAWKTDQGRGVPGRYPRGEETESGDQVAPGIGGGGAEDGEGGKVEVPRTGRRSTDFL